MSADATTDAVLPGEKPLSILLLAADTTTRKLTARILSRAGHRVHETATSEAAIAAADATTMDLLILGAFAYGAGRPFLQAQAPSLAKLPLLELAALDAAPPQQDRLPRPLDPVLLLDAVRAQAHRAGNDRPAVDKDVLQDLLKLGGQAFVVQVIAQFLEDTVAVFGQLSQAITNIDVAEFQNQAHAIRSCAANVGARTIYDLCLTWRAAGADEIRKNGGMYIRQLKDELTRARDFLRSFEDEAHAA